MMRKLSLGIFSLYALTQSANAAYVCIPQQECTFIVKEWYVELSCRVVTKCNWVPDQPTQPSNPTPTPPPPPPPKPPMTPEEKKRFCDSAPYEINADKTNCEIEARKMGDIERSKCSASGTLNWSFSYQGVRVNAQATYTQTYTGVTNSCGSAIGSAMGYSIGKCRAGVDLAKGQAVGTCGPLQF